MELAQIITDYVGALETLDGFYILNPKSVGDSSYDFISDISIYGDFENQTVELLSGNISCYILTVSVQISSVKNAPLENGNLNPWIIAQIKHGANFHRKFILDLYVKADYNGVLKKMDLKAVKLQLQSNNESWGPDSNWPENVFDDNVIISKVPN